MGRRLKQRQFNRHDNLIGGTGEDNFYYFAGDGKDTITGATSDDTILLENIKLDDIVGITAENSTDIKLQFKDGGTLKIKDGLTNEVNYKVDGQTHFYSDGSWQTK